jgi:hypothetical protein
MILDFDSGSAIKTDEEVQEFMSTTFGIDRPMDLQLYNKERRNDILRAIKDFGGTIRQIVRLTGISFAIVRKA